MRLRSELLDKVRARPEVEVLIVGGGINGVGLLRDLAAQGIGALLVEKGDFCSGTSAAPSRLIHGGLRYLETGEFALVRESVEERNRLLLNAPHLVVPIPVWVPLSSWWAGLLRAPGRFFGWTRAPGAKGALVTKLGLVFYDWFGRHVGGVPKHRLVGAADLRAAMPSIAPHTRLVAEFFDARLIHPERLTLELVADAERDCPAAMALSYLALESGAGAEVLLRDRIGGEALRVRPRLVINTTGAWVDEVDASLGVRHCFIGGTRGSHLVLRHPALARELGERMIYFETGDHRICLAYGVGADLVLLGTTDIRTDDPDDGRCTDAEIDYLFRELRVAMPGIEVARGQIVFSYSGVRPLPAADGVVAGAISRDHSMRVLPAEGDRPYDIFTLVGGKWTTYRACAAQIADAVMARLRRRRTVDVAGLRIGTARDWPSDEAGRIRRIDGLVAASGLGRELIERLWSRHGCDAGEVARTIARTSAAPVADLPHYTVGEIVHIARHQRVARLADVVLRRTLIAFEGRCTGAALRALARIVGAELGWDTARIDQEVAGTAALLRERHGVQVTFDLSQPASRVAPR